MYPMEALAYAMWCWFWIEISRRTLNQVAVMARRWQERKIKVA